MTPPIYYYVDHTWRFEHNSGIRFNGQERTNVEEYCVSEGWIRVAAGRALDRRGQPMTMKLKGTVEPFFRGA